MAPTDKGIKVTKVYAGANTGDEMLIDENGTHWKKVDSLPERNTGDRHAFIINSTIHEI